MLWNLYDEDTNKFLNREFNTSLDEAIDLLVEEKYKDTVKNREYGIFLYPVDKEARLEILIKEGVNCLSTITF